MRGEEAIDRREDGVTERCRLARRLEQAQQRRQQRDAGAECDQHADPGDQPEFGHALVDGRQERQKAGRGREGRERQRRARAAAGLQQRLAQIVDIVPLGAVADAELQTEVDAQPDEQHREINGYQIERADHHQADRGGNREPDDERKKDGEDDARPAQSEPQNEQHDGDGHRGVERGVFLDRGEFLVRHRHRAGQPQLGLILAGDIEVLGRLANGVGRSFSGFELGIIEHSPNLQKAHQFVRLRSAPLHQFVPGKARRLSRIDLLDRSGGERHRPGHVVEGDLTALHAEQAELQSLDDAAQRWISGQHLHQALRLGQHFHLWRQIGRRFEQ